MPPKYKYKYKTKTTDKQIKKVVKAYIKKESETKYLITDSTTSAINFNYAGAIVPISQIAQGDSDDQRDGDQVRLQELKMKFRVLNVTATSDRVIRVIIFRWKPLATASLPTAQTILYESISQDYLTAMSSIDHKTVPSQAVVLYDKYFGARTPENPGWFGNIKINLRNVEQLYTGTTYATNQLYVCFYSQSSANDTYVFHAELMYKDL